MVNRCPSGRPHGGRRAVALAACLLAVGACSGEAQTPPGLPPSTGSPTTVSSTGLSAPTTGPSMPTAGAGSVSTTATTGPAADSTSQPTATSPAATAPPDWWHRVTPAKPLQVWVIGDSLAGPLGNALRARTTADTWLEVTTDYQGGTGLARLDFYDWPGRAAERLRELDPDVVVCLIGANDGQALRLDDGWEPFGTPEWNAQYAARVGEFMDLLAGESRRVYWVEIPIMAGADYDARVRHMNYLHRQQAALRGVVLYVEAYSLFQNEAGEFARELPDAAGNLIVVREADGVHFTAGGAGQLAEHVLALIEEDWEEEAGTD